MVGTTLATCPGRPAGSVSTCSLPCSSTGRHPGPGPAPMSARWAKTAPQPGRQPRGGRAPVNPRASQPRPTPPHPLPVRPDAGRRPRRPPTTAARRPLRPTGAARHPKPFQVQRGADSAATAPRTPQACPSGHLDTGRLDTGRLDADVRSTGWTDVPHDGIGRGGHRATTGLAGVRTSSRPATTAGRLTSPGSRRLGALGHPRLLRGDGTCAAALTAAATGHLPQHRPA